ncbi:phage protease, partial [Laribacter hongkongensis]
MAHLAPLIAALTVDLSQLGIADGEAPRVIKLLPAGSFRARDGRPVECAAWTLDTVSAASLIAEATQREVRYVIDYEHQT